MIIRLFTRWRTETSNNLIRKDITASQKQEESVIAVCPWCLQLAGKVLTKVIEMVQMQTKSAYIERLWL